MKLPFDAAQFLEVFARYNQAVWPMQLVFYALAVGALLMLALRVRHADRAMSALLALLWAWIGIVYHGMFFREINPAATLFAALFLAGAAAFAWQGVVRARLVFQGAHAVAGAAGMALIAYALVLYPLLSIVFGHPYPAAPTFGLPCPTVIFTLGVLLFLKAPYPRTVFIAPLAWAAIGVQAAVLLGMYEDFGMLLAALAGVVAAVRPITVRPRKEAKTA